MLADDFEVMRYGTLPSAATQFYGRDETRERVVRNLETEDIAVLENHREKNRQRRSMQYSTEV